MLDVIVWYLIASLVGWLVFPLAYRLFSKLPDRGLAFLRPLGLLSWGFVFWLLASFGIFANSTGEMLMALGLVAGLSLWAGRGRWTEMRDWLRARLGMILIIETLFLAALVYMAVMRSASPDITGTEKPMELAFINAILRSPGMPPNDPWLSGYAISYYYFGYLMVAMMARVSAVSGGVAFNLAVAMWFAMTAVAAYGVLYNLLKSAQREQDAAQTSMVTKYRISGVHAWALLAPLFILVLSNMGGLFEVLHANGTFWERGGNEQLTSSFWQELKIEEWENPPSEPFELTIKRGGWWWWRSSRVLQDFRLNGQAVEVIDEFPQFSYILADLHPHVLAVPFVLLVLALIYNFYLENQDKTKEKFKLLFWVRTPVFWATAVIIGALGFLNIWDFPIYLVVFGMTYALVRYLQSGWNFTGLVGDFLSFVLVLGIAGALAYAPFYLGFSSQAGPPYFYLSLAFFTPGANFWIMFATLLIPLFVWLIWIGLRTEFFMRQSRNLLWRGLAFSTALVFGLWGLSYLVGLILSIVLAVNPEFSAFGQPVGQWFFAQQGSLDGFALLGETFLRRLAQPGTWLTLLVLLALGWAAIGALRKNKLNTAEELGKPDYRSSASLFVLVLALAGAGLTLFPEFFFLKDDFGARMNTIFKFYYQAWIMWAIAAAFGTIMLWKNLRRIWKAAFGLVSFGVISLGLIYPIYGFLDRMSLLDSNSQNNFPAYGLDGTAYAQQYFPDEWQAVEFLRTAPDGVILEAVGGQYSQYARIATWTGLPNVLGWPGHEGQWRGTRVDLIPRNDQVQILYETSNWEEAKVILDLYKVRYIFIGSLELSTYRVNEEKFTGHVAPIYSNNSVVIYEYVP